MSGGFHGNRRKFPRRRFSHLSHPRIRIENEIYPITDIGDKGLRFLVADASVFGVGQNVEGGILLKGNRTLDVTGTISRIENYKVAVLLDAFFPIEVVRNDELELVTSEVDA